MGQFFLAEHRDFLILVFTGCLKIHIVSKNFVEFWCLLVLDLFLLNYPSHGLSYKYDSSLNLLIQLSARKWISNPGKSQLRLWVILSSLDRSFKQNQQTSEIFEAVLFFFTFRLKISSLHRAAWEILDTWYPFTSAKALKNLYFWMTTRWSFKQSHNTSCCCSASWRVTNSPATWGKL